MEHFCWKIKTDSAKRKLIFDMKHSYDLLSLVDLFRSFLSFNKSIIVESFHVKALRYFGRH